MNDGSVAHSLQHQLGRARSRSSAVEENPSRVAAVKMHQDVLNPDAFEPVSKIGKLITRRVFPDTRAAEKRVKEGCK